MNEHFSALLSDRTKRDLSFQKNTLAHDARRSASRGTGRLKEAVFTLALMGCCAWANASPVNALWNDVEGFGLWLYDSDERCTEHAYSRRNFIALGPGGAHTAAKTARLDVRTLQLCIRVDGHVITACRSGSLEIQFDAITEQYSGTFELVFEDDVSRSGEFRAQRCDGPQPDRNPGTSRKTVMPQDTSIRTASNRVAAR